MKNFYKLGLAGILCGAIVGFTAPIFAQEASPEASTEASTEASPLSGILKGLTVSGFVDVNYFYNFRRHSNAPQQNTLSAVNYVGENENNSFTFESFTLFLDKAATDDHPIGWQMHTYFGEKAKRITFLGEAGTNDPDRGDIFTVATANVSWKAPVGNGLTLTLGKMYTWIGAELVENINNPNYQHGILYNNAIPFTHTGLKAGYDITEQLYAAVYLVNGWDSFIDNNSSKSLGWYVSYKPIDKLFVSLAGIHGAEGWDGRGVDTTQRSSSTGGLTQMLDLVATYQLTDKFKLLFNADWGVAEDGAMTALGGAMKGSTGHWSGVALYGLYDFTDSVQGAVRFEYFDDTDGVRYFDQSIWSTTVTANIKMRENLLLRPEYRFVHYADPDSIGNMGDDEHIVGIGVEYLF